MHVICAAACNKRHPVKETDHMRRRCASSHWTRVRHPQFTTPPASMHPAASHTSTGELVHACTRRDSPAAAICPAICPVTLCSVSAPPHPHVLACACSVPTVSPSGLQLNAAALSCLARQHFPGGAGHPADRRISTTASGPVGPLARAAPPLPHDVCLLGTYTSSMRCQPARHSSWHGWRQRPLSAPC